MVYHVPDLRIHVFGIPFSRFKNTCVWYTMFQMFGIPCSRCLVYHFPDHPCVLYTMFKISEYMCLVYHVQDLRIHVFGTPCSRSPRKCKIKPSIWLNITPCKRDISTSMFSYLLYQYTFNMKNKIFFLSYFLWSLYDLSFIINRRHFLTSH